MFCVAENMNKTLRVERTLYWNISKVHSDYLIYICYTKNSMYV